LVQEESHKFYFKNFGHSYKFLQILEVYPIFWNLKQLKNDKNRCTVTGLKPGHGLPCMAGPKHWLGLGLAAQPSRGDGPRCAETGRASCALTVRSPRKVLPATTGGVPWWRWVGGGEAGLTLVAARREGVKRQRRRRGGGRRWGREGSGGHQRAWRGPAARGRPAG
jgi:hypothetical protein